MTRFLEANKLLRMVSVVILIWGTSSCRHLHSPYKTDGQLISNFQANKGNFNRLIEMARADNQTFRLTSSGDKRPKVITAQRAEEYEKLLRELSIEEMSTSAGYPVGHVDSVWLTSHADNDESSNRCVYREAKGYRWMESELIGMKPVDDLDREYVRGNGVGTIYPVYHRIEEHWYLYYFHQEPCEDYGGSDMPR